MKIDTLTANVYKHPVIKALIKTAIYPAVIVRRALLKKKYLWQREVMANLSDVLIGNPVIRVDEFGGVFSVDPHSDLFYRAVMQKCYEPKLVQLCLKYLDKNRDVIDVGANIGFYTVMFAKNITKQRKVLSIEPTKNAIQSLRRNIELNGVIDRVEVFEGVASEREGVTEINTIRGKEEYSTLGKMELPSTQNEKWTSESVKSTTLNKLVEDTSLAPGFIKIDCEGAEYLVLQGAQKVLQAHRPVLFVEIHHSLLIQNSSSAKEVIDLIKAHEYDIFDPINPSIEPGAKDPGDILCFPKEMKVQACK